MADLRDTRYFKVKAEPELSVRQILKITYDAMSEKGYNPVSQIVGYIMSGDPTYITSYAGARALISKAERDEILEEIITTYIETMQSGR